MRSTYRLSLLLLSAAACLAVLRIPQRSDTPAEGVRGASHTVVADDDGAASTRAQRRAEAEDEGPRPENPDEFARALYEMRIPSDRTRPEYAAGYRFKEVERARQLALGKRGPSEALPWVSRGPGNVAGRVRAIVPDPDDATGNTWFIGSVGGGVWKTVDAGATWTALTDDFPNLACSALAMAPSDHDVLYVGTGESFYNVDTVNGSGMLKSIDRGVTWTPLASTVDNLDFNNIARIVVREDNPDVVLVAATPGRYKESLHPRSSIFKSVDGGLSWTEVYAETDIGQLSRVKRVLQIVATPGNPNVLYATVREKGILKSTNGGDTWSFINTGITTFAGRYELAISPVDPNRLFVAAESSPHSELFVSLTAGNLWTETIEAGTEPNWLGAQGWYDNTIVCHPTNPNIVYVGGIRLWQITWSGPGSSSRTSTQLTMGPVHVDEHGLEVIPASGGDWRLLNSNDGGIGLSTSQASGWTAPIDGLTTTQFYGVDKRPGASAYFGGMQDNGTWFSEIDPTSLDPWTFAIGGDGYETSWHFDDPQRMIGGFQYNGLRRSLDGGASWTSATNGLTDTGSASAPFITKIAKSNAAPDLLFAVGASGVWRSTDFGASWALTPIAVAQWGPNSTFTDVEISRADPDVVWAGQRMDGTGDILVSTNGGLSFSSTTDYTASTMGVISGMASHPTQPGTAYVLFSFAARPKILRTTDYGVNWTDITGFGGGSPSTNGFPDVAVYDLMVFPDDVNRIWAATEIGLFESLDNGATWADADNGLPHVAIWDMNPVEDEVVLGTHGRGIWSVKIPSMIAGQTFRPLIDNLSQGPDGALTIDLNLRSAYDSTQIYVDGARLTTLPANVPFEDALVQAPVVASGTRTVFARGYRAGVPYQSVDRTLDVIVLAEPSFEYQNDFDPPTSDWVGSGFTMGTDAGFSSSTIHTAHPYADGTTAVYRLTVPIRVALSDAYVSFDEIAIVEPGDPGSVFGDPNFYDYVVLEGSLDGVHWTPIEDGWDARRDAAWEAAFNSSSNGTPAMLRPHVFDLHNVYAPGQTVLLRLRLYADDFVNGWGWCIDNIEIQIGSPTAGPPAASLHRLELAQNAPNPFNPATTIGFTVPQAGPVTLRVYDVRGRQVRTLVDEPKLAGSHSVTWDGRDDGGAEVASGAYVYRVAAAGTTLHRKMVLVR